MFHWICPECGREIPPTVRECPSCDPKAAAAETAPLPAANPPNRMASVSPELAPLPEAAPISPLTAASQATREVEAALNRAPVEGEETDSLVALAEQVHAAQLDVEDNTAPPASGLSDLATAMEVEPAPTRAAEPTPAQVQRIEHLMNLLVPSAATESEVVVAVASPVSTEQPAAATEVPSTSQALLAAGIPLLAIAPPSEAAPQSAASEEARTLAIPVEAEHPPEHQTVEHMKAAEPEVPAPVAGLVPSHTPLLTPVSPAPAGLAGQMHPAAVPQTPVPALDSPAPKLVLAEPVPQSASIQKPPISGIRRAMRPAPGSKKIYSANSGPNITLAGPMLPPELISFREGRIVTVLGSKKVKSSGRSSTATGRLPGWLVSFLVACALVGAGLVVVLNFLPHSSADARPEPAPTEQTLKPAPVESVHPLSQTIEVTGFRMVVEASHKPEIHYLVVNHSDSAIGDLTLFVTLHATNAKPGQPPVCKFSFRAPKLEAFESKEMVSPIEKLPRQVTLPGWQDLRADVEVAQ